MSDWQPIETAPSMAANVILFDPRLPMVAQGIWRGANDWEGCEPGWYWLWHGEGDGRSDCEPTHWMPLPDEPLPTMRDIDGKLCHEGADGELYLASGWEGA